MPRIRTLTDAELKVLWNALEDPTGLRRPLPKGQLGVPGSLRHNLPFVEDDFAA